MIAIRDSGQPMLTFMPDGSLIIGEPYSATDAAKYLREAYGAARDTELASLRAELEQVKGDMRMVVSHATMGRTAGDGMSVNDISVTITALRNELFKDATATGAEEAKLEFLHRTDHLKSRAEAAEAELEQLRREAVKADDLLAALWRYGQLHTVEGVIYPDGSHRQILDVVNERLYKRATARAFVEKHQ